MKLVYIERVDSAEIKKNDSEWMSKKEAKEFAKSDPICKQVGWLIEETAEHVLLSSLVAGDDDEADYGLVFKAPNSLIRRKIEVSQDRFENLFKKRKPVDQKT